jgi:glutathione peroxidase
MGMMRNLLVTLAMTTAAAFSASSVHEFTLNSIDGKPTPLASYKGKVLLLVNVASKCGYTKQYAGLQSLYTKYKDKGLVILGVPANNFGGQEPDSNEVIAAFCSREYNVTFPIMSKVSVNGADRTPLYQYLTDKTANPNVGGDLKWNFTKFLVGKDGKPVQRFEPAVNPDSPEMAAAIENALK